MSARYKEVLAPTAFVCGGRALYVAGGIALRRMAQPSEWVRRSRLLAQVVVAGTIALLALLIAVPLIVPHESLPEPLIVFWGIFILITALIAGLVAAYLFLTRAQTAAVSTAPNATISPEATTEEMSDFAIRLLDGDERSLMRAIVEAKGTILQRDLVRITSFSDAKVSRLLDRLEDRGLIVRERHGMSNRVRLTLHET